MQNPRAIQQLSHFYGYSMYKFTIYKSVVGNTSNKAHKTPQEKMSRVGTPSFQNKKM